MNYCSSCRSDEKVRRRARANSESALVMEQPSKRRRRIQRSAIEIACAMRTVSSRQVRPAMDTLRPTCAVFNHRCATITQVGGLDENANCARTRASFRLLGDRLDPVFVTERLGLHPTRAMSKSEEIPAGKSGEAHRRRTGVWLLEAKPRSHPPAWSATWCGCLSKWSRAATLSPQCALLSTFGPISFATGYPRAATVVPRYRRRHCVGSPSSTRLSGSTSMTIPPPDAGDRHRNERSPFERQLPELPQEAARYSDRSGLVGSPRCPGE
jgi:hypothetical protein